MKTIRHSSLVIDNHVIHVKTYATAEARMSDTTLSAGDVGRVFTQLDNNSWWLLIGCTVGGG